MSPDRSRRVAPLIALLVIIVGIVVIATAQVLNSQRTSLSPTTVDHTDTVEVTPTAEVATALDEYLFHRDRDELQAALYHLEADSVANGWTAQSHIRAGNLWRDMGDLGRALPHWEAATRVEPNANLLRQIAEIYIERGEWSIAWERIQSLMALAPNDAWALHHGGLILAPSDPSTAYGYLGRVAALENEYAPLARQIIDTIGGSETTSTIMLEVGAILASEEQWSLAENAYRYAADFYYPFGEASAYVALMRIFQGKNGESWIDEAIAIDGSNPNVFYVAGIYWRYAREYLRSEDALTQAILLAPDNPIFHTELGNTYRAMGNPLDAEIWLQSAVIISGGNPVTVAALNSFYEDEAIEISQPITEDVASSSTNQAPAILSANGWALYMQGDISGARAMIDEALVIDPDNPRALFDKARLLIETEDTEAASQLLNQLIAGDTVFAEAARDLLDELTAP